MKANPSKINTVLPSSTAVDVFWRFKPLKIKTPPPTPTNNDIIPRIRSVGSMPSVKGVKTPDSSAAIAIM